ncbi:hypothetical protein PHLGIDRAFT_13670 [Phlebiopsis gigantea 11061_1 CR5-6]|uniref:SnoaL-like domain-containing protein n=1 Tax=Phlebiopsis gigantea (strain 11061_1 CR5-6) TaxID=745531 RepID=A0A0C3SA59_PHLG1|nr:hypothetical protein PHLGIDRAFT_13670 [Phlebiopsis gigantea 11061_1 CR5-6]
MPLPIQKPTHFIERKFEELFHAKSKEVFERTFHGFVDENAAITLNGERITSTRYMEHLWMSELGNREHINLNARFKETVETVKDPRALLQTGEVGAVYEVWTDTDGLHVVARNSINVVIKYDSIDVRKGPRLVEDLEGRVVTEVNEVSTTGWPEEPPMNE